MHSLLAAAQSLTEPLGHVGDALLAADPDDYTPNQEAVPNELKEQVQNLLGFVAWSVTGLCVAGVMMVGGKMAISHQRGEGGQHVSSLGWLGLACVLIGSAAAIVGVFI